MGSFDDVARVALRFDSALLNSVNTGSISAPDGGIEETLMPMENSNVERR